MSNGNCGSPPLGRGAKCKNEKVRVGGFRGDFAFSIIPYANRGENTKSHIPILT